jgi:hypothetical protein
MNALSKLRDEAYICRRQCSKDLLTEEAMYIHHLLSSCKAWAGLRLCPKLMIYPSACELVKIGSTPERTI